MVAASAVIPTRELHGTALFLARALWAFLVGAALITFAVSVPLGYQLFQQPCDGEACVADTLSTEGVALLESNGLTPQFYSAYALVLAVGSVLATSGMG